MKTAIVFPGQGAQHVGMVNDIVQKFPEIRQIFNQGSDLLGYDLWKLTQEGPIEKLDQTQFTQPALLTASYAIWQILKNHSDVEPAILAGHSLGEYTALVSANAMQFEDALMLVAARGEYMQSAQPAGIGSMAAVIGLENAEVQQICNEAVLPNEVLEPANYNSIGQVVIAGHKASVDAAIRLAKEKGAKLAVIIPVSVSSHCSLMLPAAKRLSERLAKVNIEKPKLPIISNVDLEIKQDPQAIKEALVQQLYLPVRWVETIQKFATLGIQRIIECGPGKILTGLNKRIDKHLKLQHTADLENLSALLNQQQAI